jgi:hypothetical protein
MPIASLRKKQRDHSSQSRWPIGIETHEPKRPLPNWPFSHADLQLTDESHGEEVFRLRIHGVDHYLTAPTVKAIGGVIIAVTKMADAELAKYSAEIVIAE